MDKPKTKMHPNSLANLKHAWDKDTAREAQLLGAAKRSANAKARAAFKTVAGILEATERRSQRGFLISRTSTSYCYAKDRRRRYRCRS